VESYLPWITGSGGALVILALWVYAFFAGKIHSDRDYSKLESQNADLKAANDKLVEALALERQRSNDATQAGAVTNQLIGGLVKLATEHRAAEAHEHSDAAREHKDAADKADSRALDLTAKDLGL
jgi:hypothetical protein